MRVKSFGDVSGNRVGSSTRRWWRLGRDGDRRGGLVWGSGSEGVWGSRLLIRVCVSDRRGGSKSTPESLNSLRASGNSFQTRGNARRLFGLSDPLPAPRLCPNPRRSRRRRPVVSSLSVECVLPPVGSVSGERCRPTQPRHRSSRQRTSRSPGFDSTRGET